MINRPEIEKIQLFFVVETVIIIIFGFFVISQELFEGEDECIETECTE